MRTTIKESRVTVYANYNKRVKSHHACSLNLTIYVPLVQEAKESTTILYVTFKERG